MSLRSKKKKMFNIKQVVLILAFKIALKANLFIVLPLPCSSKLKEQGQKKYTVSKMNNVNQFEI